MAASAALYIALRPGFGLLRLPAQARAALLAETGLEGRPSSLKIREVTQIGPYLAIIYTAGGNIGAGLMAGGAGSWSMAGVADPGALRQGAAIGGGTGKAGVATVRSGGIEVLFVATNAPQAARVVVRYERDGTVLDQPVRGNYAILWRPAPSPGNEAFTVETYDRGNRRIVP